MRMVVGTKSVVGRIVVVSLVEMVVMEVTAEVIVVIV